jgi:tight adherence protein B
MTLPGILAFLALLFVGSMLPSIWVGMAISRRTKKITEQLVEALAMVANSLKAGFGLMQSLDLAARELQHPLSTELRRMLQEVNVGAKTDEALAAMAKRSGSDDLDIAVTAMLVQQSTGGNLAEILENVAHTMRERIRIRGEIKTLTSQQMLTGIVIGGMPFALIVLFLIMNPAYMMPLFTETMGRFMLVGAAVLEFFGVMLIRRILAIEV